MVQFIKFGMVGLCNSIINYIVYATCIKAGMHYVLANIVGFIIAIFIAYLLQNRFVFSENNGSKGQAWWKLLIKTYASYAFTGLILTNFLSFFWLDIFDLATKIGPIYQRAQFHYIWKNEYALAEYIVPFFNTVITIPVNFIINKKWTYKKSM